MQIVICGYPLFSDTWKSLYIHDWHGFHPVLQSWAKKKSQKCWENSKKGSDSRTLRTCFTIRIPFSYREQQSRYLSMFFQRGVQTVIPNGDTLEVQH